ncbi:MAG: SDR family oxidoreductase [Opitutaceae bacterium]|jgi:gluconate 5-dehydrogenase|nr:SDR family oxidoreductase [Opitutaceae bacterium]
MLANPRPGSASVFSLHREVALITGGGTGIGLGIARCFVAAGARVVLVGRREPELAASCADLGPLATYVVQDITATEAAPELVRRASSVAAGPVTILVNNAGQHLKKSAADTTTEDFQAILSTHVLAAHALTRAVLPGMIERGAGNILFTSSMAAFMGVPLVSAYAAAKSAYFGLVRTLSAEVACRGVRVNAIAPGWIDSDMTRRALDSDPVRKNKVLGRTPMGRMGLPEDIGNASVYLCSPAAAFVTGVVLPVDGGASIGF